MSIFYSREVVNGFYNINSPLRLDENGKQISIETDILNTFSGGGFSVYHNDSGIDVSFSEELTSQQQTTLDALVSSHKSYKVSAVENIHRNWGTIYSDYKQARSAMMYTAYVSGFYNMTAVEKKIVSQWFSVGDSERASVYSTTEQIEHAKAYHSQSVGARTKRNNAVACEIYNRVSRADAMGIVNETTELNYQYIMFGKEGTLEGDPIGFFDYLCARSGTCWESSGLAAKNIGVLGMTMPQLVNKCMAILKSGIY